jgi:hypothetical protein
VFDSLHALAKDKAYLLLLLLLFASEIPLVAKQLGPCSQHTTYATHRYISCAFLVIGGVLQPIYAMPRCWVPAHMDTGTETQ